MKVCSIEGCQNRVLARGWCNSHYLRWHRRGTLDLVGRGRNTWTGDAATYNASHLRVKAAKGRAADQLCDHCGQPAQHWAYDHKDPDEKIAPEGPYSPDPEHYLPLCVPCHSVFDRTVPYQSKEKIA